MYIILLSGSSTEDLLVLTSSPAWLISGAAVNLSCEVKYPSAGWTYYWSEYIPKASNNMEKLHASNGTEFNTYVIQNLKLTTAYMCTAGRGEPVYYLSSTVQYVWSAGERFFSVFSISSRNMLVLK